MFDAAKDTWINDTGINIIYEHLKVFDAFNSVGNDLIQKIFKYNKNDRRKYAFIILSHHSSGFSPSLDGDRRGNYCFIIAIIVSTWIYLNQDEMTWKEYGIFMIGTMIFASVMIGLITWSLNNFLMYGSWLIFPAFLLTWKRKIEDEADESD